MRNKINIPGFTADVNLNEFGFDYSAVLFDGNIEKASAIYPQYHSHVTRHCGPCRNGKRLCILSGYECSMVGGFPGNDDLGIPPSPGHLQCEPATLDSWEIDCVSTPTFSLGSFNSVIE